MFFDESFKIPVLVLVLSGLTAGKSPTHPLHSEIVSVSVRHVGGIVVWQHLVLLNFLAIEEDVNNQSKPNLTFSILLW